MARDLDLNDPPPVENMYQMRSSLSIFPERLQAPEVELSLGRTTTNSEHDDDEVMICSPRSFAEARENARRNNELIELLDTEIESRRGRAARSSPRTNRRRRAPARRRTGGCSICINLEAHDESKSENVAVPQELSHSIPQPKVPSYSCPVCMGPFDEATSTKCGHIFCKKCITTALAVQSKCPTCRRKIKAKDNIKIYLPTSD